jgi:hypothetical protein
VANDEPQNACFSNLMGPSQQVANFAYLRWELVYPEITARQAQLETCHLQLLHEVDAKACFSAVGGGAGQGEYATDACVTNAENLVQSGKEAASLASSS